ncbi:MAG: ABC transporter substrate-binding protein [Deltaproteobacteria bacterium]|nr:ABC transporter substrate-binding protein [Deltaproteobacteria bacterium]
MKRSYNWIIVAAAVAALISLGGCRTKAATPPEPEPGAGPTEEAEPEAPEVPGVTDEKIVIGQWSPQTGPAALWGSVARGTAAYFDMINEQGGVHGRKLELIIRDDGYNPTRTVAAAKEMAEQEEVFCFIGGVGTATGMAVKDYLAKKEIPWIGPASGSSNWSTPATRNLFSLYPKYETEAALLTRYVVEELKKEKVAFFYQNDDYGKEGLDGVKNQLAAMNMELAAEISVEVADTDLSSHVLKLKASKADVVILWLMPKHAAITLGTAAKLGFKPQWVTGSTLSDAPLMNKITEGLWEGVIFDTFVELPDSEHELIKKYRAAYEKHGLARNDKEQWGIFFMAGFYFAEPVVAAMEAAGPELTREKLVAELEKLDAWDGGIGHAITFGPEERQGQKSVFLAKCEGGKAVKISDWLVLDGKKNAAEENAPAEGDTEKAAEEAKE